MKIKNKISERRKGFSIIEMLVLLFVFSVVTLSFYAVFSLGTKYILESKNRTVAISLLNERMEFLRNLSYDSVATVGGIPAGTIEPEENITLSGRQFKVEIDVKYFDDTDDGSFGGVPNDAVPNDYKIVAVIVSWGEGNSDQRIKLVSKFVPPGIETSVGGGALSLNTIDFTGAPVPNVSVHLTNSQVAPAVDYNTETGSNGNLMLQGVPADSDPNYQFTLAKSGYETVVTYPIGGAFIPADKHSAILEGILNEKTIKIDKLASFKISSKDPFDETITDVEFDLIGGRRLDDGSSDAVYNYDESQSTGGDGDISVEDVSAGDYEITITGDTDTDYVFWKMNPGKDLEPTKFSLLPDDDLDVEMILVDQSLPALFISIIDEDTNSAIEGAEIKVTNTILGYDVTLTTDKYGKAYFPEEIAVPLVNGEDYVIEVSATDYQDNTESKTVNNYTAVEIKLLAD